MTPSSTPARPVTDHCRSGMFIAAYPDGAHWADHRQLRDHPPRRERMLTRGRVAAEFIRRSPGFVLQKVTKKQSYSEPLNRVQKCPSERRLVGHMVSIKAAKIERPSPLVRRLESAGAKESVIRNRSTGYHNTLAMHAMEQLNLAAADQHESAWFDPGLRTAWFDDDEDTDDDAKPTGQVELDAVEHRAASLARLEGCIEENVGCLAVGPEHVVHRPSSTYNSIDEIPTAIEQSIPGRSGADQRATWHSSVAHHAVAGKHVIPHPPSLTPAVGKTATPNTPAIKSATNNGRTTQSRHLGAVAHVSATQPLARHNMKHLRKSAPPSTSLYKAYRQPSALANSAPPNSCYHSCIGP
ncbi:hypothetical protein K431DRAFT_302703 [Polychaeton citri CBS 116435]|uniref:Uncharacterized protein n=1 Tax=Polychaeton citri CBS 116435 TaxID=1314669 RepID=A0A9P4UR08_9PEZI|nr:hypothetical protein K431DRAFT_302703 [Polychaeton citri CBS 116435]